VQALGCVRSRGALVSGMRRLSRNTSIRAPIRSTLGNDAHLLADIDAM
jgi:hypothetical protein